MAATPRDRRDRRARGDDPFKAERISDLAVFAGFIGLASGMFVIGRVTSGAEKCCDDVVARDVEIIKLRQQLAAGR